jgi:hypothetical protein
MTNTVPSHPGIVPGNHQTMVHAFGQEAVALLLGLQANMSSNLENLEQELADTSPEDRPWDLELRHAAAQDARRATKCWRLPRSPRATSVQRPRCREVRPGRARSQARSSARSGDSGDDGPGEPAPGDLDEPQHHQRICAICGDSLEGYRADARVCRKAKCRRAKSRDRQPVPAPSRDTACDECGRQWLSDMSPVGRRCPDCGGMVVLGTNARIVREQLVVDRAPRTGSHEPDEDEFVGIKDLGQILECVYRNGTIAVEPGRKRVAFTHPGTEECVRRGCRQPAECPSAFCTNHTHPHTEELSVDNVIDLDAFRQRYETFITALSHTARDAVAA